LWYFVAGSLANFPSVLTKNLDRKVGCSKGNNKKCKPLFGPKADIQFRERPSSSGGKPI